MRKLVVLAAVLVALALVADRVSLSVAQDKLAQRMQSTAHLRARPTVQVKGFPFLTQAFQGRYGDIQVTATDLDRGGVHIARLDATLHGVHVPLSDVLDGAVTRVPVDALTATVVVSYADLAHRSRMVGLRIEPAGSVVHVTARLRVLGQTVTATAVSDVRLRNGSIVLTARSLKALGQVTPSLLNALTGRLDLNVPVGTLPYDLSLVGLSITPAGLVLEARADGVVLTAA